MIEYHESELILNPDGSIFHLRLFPEQLADHILLVGDPGRVELAGQFLERVEHLATNREFTSLAGYFGEKRVMVLSTGIGTDNIDIVVNELDALANIDLERRQDRPERRNLNLIRIGTSGAIQPDLEPGTFVASAWSLGLDGLMAYYRQENDPIRQDFLDHFFSQVNWPAELPRPYAVNGSGSLLEKSRSFCEPGITVAAHGFYGPQGRKLRVPLRVPDLNERLKTFRYGSLRTTNFEMESSALYGLSKLLDHNALTVCLIIANRIAGKFLGDYKESMKELIVNVLTSIIK
jgi:uridine phosphorylase